MKLAVPVQKPPPPQQQQQLDHAAQQQQQQQQTSDLLAAAQQQLQHLFQQQPGGLASLQQNHEQQEQLQPPAAAALAQASSGVQNQFTVRTGWTRASVDTTGIANRSSSSPAAGSMSPMRSHTKGSRAVAQGLLSPLQAALATKETETSCGQLDLSIASAACGAGASMPAVDLARLGVGMAAAEGWQQVGAAAAAADSSEAAAQVRLVCGLVAVGHACRDTNLRTQLCRDLACMAPLSVTLAWRPRHKQVPTDSPVAALMPVAGSLNS
jgi:hypothetical protein